jgi:hypothetical protein
MDPLSRGEPAGPECCGDTVDRRLGGSTVEPPPTARKLA